MGWMQCTLSMVGALAWPAAILAVVLALRHEARKQHGR